MPRIRFSLVMLLLTALCCGTVVFAQSSQTQHPPAQQTRAQDTADTSSEVSKDTSSATAPSSPTLDAVPPLKETVVVTGEAIAVPLEEADRAITALPTREYPELYRTWTDYVELEPSLDLQQRSPDGIQGDLSIRGSAFGQTLVLVNGLRMNDAQTGHHNLDLPLPLASVDRIEILRGAGSTLYGSDAVGGAVNFITSPASASEFRMGVAVGSFGTNQQDLSAAYVNRRLSQQVSFSRDFSSGFMPDRDYRSVAIASESHVKSTLGETAIVLGYSDRPFGADQFYGPYNSWERTKSWLASIRQPLGQKTEVAFAYRRHTDNFILERDRPSLYANNHETESWQGAVRRHEDVAKNATLFYGAEGYGDVIDSNNLGHHGRARGAAYVNFDARAMRRFSLSVGAREEVYGGGQHQFSPTVSGGVWLSQHFKLRASASHAFRVPSYTELYYSDPTTVGNAALRPESAWSYEGGLNWHANDRVSGDVTVFHRREHDGIDYVKYSPTDLWHAINFDELQFTGVEATTRVRINSHQQLQLSYVGLHGSQSVLAGIQSRYVGNYPTQNAVAAWQGTLPGKLLARTRIGVTERRERDPYALWDLALARRIRWFSPFVKFANLTDTSYQEIPGIPLPGRSVLAGFEFTISAAK